MTQPTRQPSVETDEERRNRERMLDETLEDSFPASDPLSTNPNPDNHGVDDREPAAEEEDEDHGRTSKPTRNSAS